MIDKCSYIRTKHRLFDASESLVLAYWTKNEYHVCGARESLVKALCGGDRAELEDMIAEAIRDTHDIDVTDADYARAVVDALLDYAIPDVENNEPRT